MTMPVLFGADSADVDLFRARVAMHMAPNWVKRANALKLCGAAGVKLRCPCGCAQLVPFRCQSRACPICARIVAARKTARVANRVALKAPTIEELWDGRGPARKKGWKLFTGTLRAGDVAFRYDPAVLKTSILKVRRAWGPFWRSTPWGRRVQLDRVDADGVVVGRSRRARRDTAAVMGIEVAPGGMVHLHAAIYGEWVDTSDLARLWSDALGEKAFVKIRAMRAQTAKDFDKALREVLKYVTKWDKAPGEREQRAAAIEVAMRGVRRVEMIGAIRAMPGADDLVQHDNPQACVSCGNIGEWAWSGIWTPEKVQANGGFGRVVAALDDAERRAFRQDPTRARVESIRDANDALIRELGSPDAEADSSAPITEAGNDETL